MSPPPAGKVRTGISGWRYPPWRGVFYPPGLPQRRELEHASRRLRPIADTLGTAPPDPAE